MQSQQHKILEATQSLNFNQNTKQNVLKSQSITEKS